MKIIFIGAGNLATHLAQALKNAGHEIIQVYSRTRESAEMLATKVGAHCVTDIDKLCTDADACIMAVKDSALEELISKACVARPNIVFMHTAGSMPMSLFENHAKSYGVLYPMQSFSKERAVDFAQIPCFLEWNGDRARIVITRLAESVSDKHYEMNSDARKHLHLAAVFASNFVNHCYALSAELLDKYDLPFDVMLPLTDEVARKVHEMTPTEAQTGPAVRYDENVMDKHKRMLDDEPLMKDIYEKMSESIHHTALKKQ